MEEIIDDILLSLLIYNVDNKNKWIWIDLLRLKINCDDEFFNKALNELKERKFIEMKNKNYVRITKNGIKYIVEKV